MIDIPFPVPSNMDIITANQFIRAVNSMLSVRSQWNRNQPDPRRDLNDECGWPTGVIPVSMYQDLFDNDAIAARVVEILPIESWAVSPDVYESEDPNNVTGFESDWMDLALSIMTNGIPSCVQDPPSHPVLDHLELLDIMCGIGSYGIMVLGTDDGLDFAQPATGMIETNSVPMSRDDVKMDSAGNMVIKRGRKSWPRWSMTTNAVFDETPQRKLLSLQCFPETLAQISAWEMNPTSPRYGMPTEYLVSWDNVNQSTVSGMPVGTVKVHWSRVVHAFDNPSSSRWAGGPRMQPVLPKILDCRKEYGASGEGYYRAGFPGISMETHPTLGGDVDIDRATTRSELEQYMNGLQRYLVSSGLTAKTLSPNVADPTPFIEAQINGICIRIDVPKRVFMGSERGELASSQDDRRWKGKLRRRRIRHCNTRLLFPFINLAVALGILRKPQSGCKVAWPDQDSQTELEKADVALKKTQAIGTFVTTQGDAVISPQMWWSHVMGATEEESKQIVKDAVGVEQVMDRQAQDQQDIKDATRQQPMPKAGDKGSSMRSQTAN